MFDIVHIVNFIIKGTNMDITHKPAKSISDKVAYALVKFFRFFADVFFKKRYGPRAVVLETVASIPGMIGAANFHFKCLRKFKNDEGWITTLLEEAENERMHLMVFLQIARPSWFERFIIFIAQALFIVLYFTIYIISSKTAHRFVGYLEEEAVVSYQHYLDEIDAGKIKNIKAPRIAIDYWSLAEDATLRDVVIKTKADEEKHRDVNHNLSDRMARKEEIITSMVDTDAT